MKNKNDKKGLFGLFRSKKNEKSSSCCNIEIEEIPEENNVEKDEENEASKTE